MATEGHMVSMATEGHMVSTATMFENDINFIPQGLQEFTHRGEVQYYLTPKSVLSLLTQLNSSKTKLLSST